MRGLGRKQAQEPSAAPVAPAFAPPLRPPGTAGPSGASADGAAPQQTRAALELAQELLRGLEHFVLSTPDLDAPNFLDRLRRIAAQLTMAAQAADLEGHRQWAADSLSAFGQLQRRYLSEREDELWRLLTVYQDHLKVEGAANSQFNESLEGVHERMGNVVRLDDLRQVRERLEGEIQRAGVILEQKSKADDERAALLSRQVEQLEAQLVAARHEADRDPLTGVYHRGGFEAQLAAALESPTPAALAMIDLDNFKGVNDTLGHLVGDHILQIAVQILGKIARPGDVIGRYGGDEFCVLSPGTAPQRLADRFNSGLLRQDINFHFEDRICSVRFSMSVGVAGSVPGDTLESLFQRADQALLETKRMGKGRARVSTPA